MTNEGIEALVSKWKMVTTVECISAVGRSMHRLVT
jgi:hypothetical protein